MALDPNIILQAGNYPRADAGQMIGTALNLLGARDQLQARQEQRALQQRQIALQDAELARAQAKQQRLGDIGKAAAGGDIPGAQRMALEAGDFDTYAEIAKLGEAGRKALATKYGAAAPVALQAGQYPMAVRRNIIMAAAPQLKAAGWTDEEIAGFDPTDENIGGLVASTQTVNDVLERLDKDRKFALDQDKFGEEKRRNRATEGLTLRGQNITMRGQNMVDARAREANAAAAGPNGVKMTEGQAKDGFNAKRLAGAGAIIDGFENTKGFKPGATGPGAFFGDGQSRQYEAAKNEWVDALIRLTTGAAATKDEIEQAKTTYFPSALDGSDAITQKANMRARVMQDAVTRAGPGAAGAAPATASGAPKPGTVQDGYRFKGGNPADPKSWVKL